FRPRNRYRAGETPAADDANAIHHDPRGPSRRLVLIAAPIAAKVGSLRFRPAISGGFRLVARAVVGAATRLRLAPLKVFPQRRGKPRAARRLLFGLAAFFYHRRRGGPKAAPRCAARTARAPGRPGRRRRADRRTRPARSCR